MHRCRKHTFILLRIGRRNFNMIKALKCYPQVSRCTTLRKREDEQLVAAEREVSSRFRVIPAFFIKCFEILHRKKCPIKLYSRAIGHSRTEVDEVIAAEQAQSKTLLASLLPRPLGIEPGLMIRRCVRTCWELCTCLPEIGGNE